MADSPSPVPESGLATGAAMGWKPDTAEALIGDLRNLARIYMSTAYEAVVAKNAGNALTAAMQEIERLRASARSARAELAAVEDQRDSAIEALQQIESWSNAYPLDIFPEPDFAKAHELLMAGGITLDAVSASCMRHVVEGAGKIASTAIRSLKTAPKGDGEGT